MTVDVFFCTLDDTHIVDWMLRVADVPARIQGYYASEDQPEQDGDLRARSERDGRGATFVVDLPFPARWQLAGFNQSVVGTLNPCLFANDKPRARIQRL